MVPCPIPNKIHSCGINEKVQYKFIRKTRARIRTKFIFHCMNTFINYRVIFIMRFEVGVIISISYIDFLDFLLKTLAFGV